MSEFEEEILTTIVYLFVKSPNLALYFQPTSWTFGIMLKFPELKDGEL